MEQRIGRKKYRIFAYDVESHNCAESIAKNKTSIWLSCFIDETSTPEDEASYIYTISDFLDRIDFLSSQQRKHAQKRPCKNICVYIYNLSFEWSFILPWLLKRGFTFKEEIGAEDEKVFNSVSTRSVSSVWQVQLKFAKKSGTVLLRDLAKIYGGGLGKVAKSFGLPTQKGEIDYKAPRLRPFEETEKITVFLTNKYGPKDAYNINEWDDAFNSLGLEKYPDYKYTPTQEEKNYCFNDVRIIVDILLIMQKKGDKTFFNVSSMASYSMKKLIAKGWPRSVKPFREYRKMYPELGADETDFLRHSVSGGITYAPERWQFKDIKQPVVHIDAHNFHPSQMYSKLFPYGVGEYHTGKPTDFKKINCCHIKVSYTAVRLHSVIKLIGVPFVDDFELYVWDFEIPTMVKCYVDLEIKYIDYYAYNARMLPFRQYPAENYRKRLIAKQQKDDFNILYYKLLNNSSYGKFLENPHNVIFKNTVDPFGIITSDTEEKTPDAAKVNAKYTYLPLGSCIPAYSRVTLINLAFFIGWENVVYFDTDSLFFIKTPETWAKWESPEVNKKDFLCGWALEEIIDRCQFACAKRYKAEVNGKSYFKMAGINLKNFREQKANREGIAVDDVSVSFDEINIISSVWKVQRAYRCKGGTLIEFQEKKIEVQDKYIDIFKKNMLK